MIRKFAMLAAIAAIFASCGGNMENDAAAKAKADSLSAAMTADSMAKAAEAAAAAATPVMDSTATPAADTTNKMMDATKTSN